MKNIIFILAFISLLYGGSKKPPPIDGSLFISYSFSTNKIGHEYFNNTIIKYNKKEQVLLSFQKNTCFLSNVTAGFNKIEIYIHDAVHGDYYWFKELNILEGKTIYLTNIILTENYKTEKKIIEIFTPNNSRLILNGFNFDEEGLEVIDVKKNIFINKSTWYGTIEHFGQTILQNYILQYSKYYIKITGHASRLEQNEYKSDLKLLSLRRATFIYQFITDNFNVPNNFFMITGVGSDYPTLKSKPGSKKNRKVTISFNE